MARRETLVIWGLPFSPAASRKKVTMSEKKRTWRATLMTRVAEKKMAVSIPAQNFCFSISLNTNEEFVSGARLQHMQCARLEIANALTLKIMCTQRDCAHATHGSLMSRDEIWTFLSCCWKTLGSSYAALQPSSSNFLRKGDA